MKNQPAITPPIIPPVQCLEQKLAPIGVKADEWNIVDRYKQRNIFGEESILYVMKNKGEIKSVTMSPTYGG